MFWRKCGKIIRDDGGIVRCDRSPCPYYAIFGFKYRSLNQDTMEPYNKCSWQFDIGVYTVDQGKIEWMGACINVSTNVGECAHKKFKSGCWTDCAEWDENDNCIREEEYCDFVYEVYVYNISGCYDDYDKFQDAFFGECGIERNEEGKYDQDILDENDRPWDCLERWNQKFKSEYALSFKVDVKSQIQSWSICGISNDNEWVKWCGCPDSLYETTGDCPDDCEWWWETKGWLSVGSSASRMDLSLPNPPFSQYYKYVKGGGSFTPEGWYYQRCCDENGARSKLGEAAEYAFSFIDKPEAYRNNGTNTHECVNSNDLCFEFEYNSRGDHNPYGDPDTIEYNFRWFTLLLKRRDDTPKDAVGVKFNVHLTKTRMNTGDFVDEDKTVTEEDMEMILYFDEEYKDLPFSKNITRPSYLYIAKCGDDCYYADENISIISPYPTGGWAQNPQKHDNWTEYFKYNFIALEYIKNK